MRTRLRSLVHLVHFIGAAEWVYQAALGGFVLGLLASIFQLPQMVAVVLAAFGGALGLVLLVKDTMSLVGRWSDWTMRRRNSPLSFRREVHVPGLPTIVATGAGRAAIDERVDLLLPDATNRLRWGEVPYSLPSTLASAAPYVLRRSARGRWPFNGPNVSLATDVSCDTVLAGTEVVTREGDFYSALCSNELTGWVLSRDGAEFDFWGRYLFDSRGSFISLAASELNNGIGVSTLAVTTDNYVVITLQSPHSQTSPGLWAPSGSGALEPRDIQHGGLLTAAICRGAERELREETRIAETSIYGSTVIGYSRWLDRGGKPEFYCLTRLRVSSRELGKLGQVHPPLSEERLWTSGLTTVALSDGVGASWTPTAGSLAERPACWRESGLIVDDHVLDDSVSVSLELALDALARQFTRRPALLSEIPASTHASA